MPDDFGFGEGPPPEVLGYLKAKGWKPAFSYKDVWGAEHAMAFTVAKAMELDVLMAIRGALEDALAKGKPFKQFQKELTPTLQRLGWWGKGTVVDPKTSEPVRAQLGSPRRLRTIYRANIRTARAAGQWERAQRTKAAAPYFRYELGPSEKHRPHHASKEGLILPIDDPFWNTWMPPNGWGCKCRVRQVTDAEMRRRGWTVDPAPKVPTTDWINDRTGKVMKVPEGIDPAWVGNPGKHRQKNLDDFLAGKLAAVPDEMARVASYDLLTGPKFKAIQSGHLTGHVPVAMLSKDLADALGSKSRVVLFSSDTAAKQLKRHPDLKPEDYVSLQDVLDNGMATKSWDRDRNAVFHIRKDDKWWQAVIKRTTNNTELWLVNFQRTSERDQQRISRKGTTVRK
ncbi:MAG: phage minor head protein [Pseudomonadota bacterium]